MKEKDKYQKAEGRISLEDLPRPADPRVPEGYFESLEMKLRQIPDARGQVKVRRLRPWTIAVSAAAAVALLVMFYVGVFERADQAIATEDAYAYLSETGMNYDATLDIAITEAYLEEGYLETSNAGAIDDWLISDEAAGSEDEEAILEYLGDHADLDDIATVY